MRTLHTTIAVFCLLLCSSLAFAQAVGDFQSFQTGNWNDVNTWSSWNGSAWVNPVASVPSDTLNMVTILNGHTVTATADVSVDSLFISGVLNVPAGVAFTILKSDVRGMIIDSVGVVNVDGYLNDQNSITLDDGVVAKATIIFNNGSTYEYAHPAESGKGIPKGTWNTGSTLLISGLTSSTNGMNGNQDFYNVVVNAPNITSNLNMGWFGNTIGGDITCQNTGVSRIYFTSPGAGTPNTITINGNVYVTGGVLSSNGSSSIADIYINQYGNIIVTGGNFGCSRGSGPSVYWSLYGDSMYVTGCTLQNSTGGRRPQKFIFAKAGTQKLIAYNFVTAPSRQGWQVNNGTTLDIGRSFSTNDTTCDGMNGAFQIEPGGKVWSIHDAIGEGRIRTSGAYGGNTIALDVRVTEGEGNILVTAFEGDHPGIVASPTPDDTASMLKRYWRVEADPGITKSVITMYYNDIRSGDPPEQPTDIRGTELNYQAIRIYQYGPEWRKWVDVDSSYADDVVDKVVTGTVSNVAADWSAGDGISSGVGQTPPTGGIPLSFYVNQNYPNPFNPVTQIKYGIPHNSFVTVKVFNLIGQEVATLYSGEQTLGNHIIDFDGSRLSSGVYFYRVQAGYFVETKKMVLAK